MMVNSVNTETGSTLKRYECLLIEILIAVRLGGQFFVQLMNLFIKGSIEEQTSYSIGFKYLLIIGIVYALVLIVKYKLYFRLSKKAYYFFLFELLYVAFLYYYIMVSPESIYSGIDASSKFIKVLNNVLLFNVVSVIYVARDLNQNLICKIFVVINFITSIIYLNTLGIDFGDSFDGFLLQSTGFSSLSIGYLSGANLIVSIYLAKTWSKNVLVNNIVTIILVLLFSYIIIVCGKTGPTLFSLFASMFALKYSLFPNMKLKTCFVLIGLFLLLFVLFYREFADLVSMFNPNLSRKIIATIAEGSTSNRDFLYEEAINQITDNWFLGSYFELQKYQIYPHNFFLENMITWGICGTIVMLFVLKKAFVFSLKLLKEKSDIVWVGITFLFSFLSLQTTGSIYGNFKFWFCLSVLMVVENTRKLNK